MLACSTLGSAVRPFVVLALAAIAAGGAPASARAQAPTGAPTVEVAGPSGEDLSVRAGAIADEVVRRWASVQNASGRFPDPLYGSGGDYGTAMLGYAMLRRGAQEGDKGLIRGGLDALLAQVDKPAGGAFELLVLARAYRWANGALPGNAVAAPFWAKAGPRLAADLAARGPIASQTASATCYSDARCYNNLKLVSSLASLELIGTGLAPASPSALLADIGLKGRVEHRLSSRVPKETGGDVTRVGKSAVGGGGILSDPPRNPLAYHVLSTMMLGEVLDELGDAAPAAALKAYGRAARALLVLTAPDGDLTWFGRGQGQVWVPAVAAAAAAGAAERTSSTVLRGRFLALAETSLARLREVYGVGPRGLPLVPGAVDADILGARAVDPYATTRGYNGLAVYALDRASATLKRVAATATRLPSERTGVVRSPQQGGLASITRGGLWVGIAAKSRAPEDARYSSGLLAMQHRDAAGAWKPVVPGRPYNPQRVGTLAIKVGGRTLVASGSVAQPGPSAVVIRGGWAEPGAPKTLVDRNTTWRWALEDQRTLAVTFRARSTRQLVLNGLMGDGATFQKVPFGFVVTNVDGSAVEYRLGVAGRRLGLQRSTRPAGASAYDAAVTNAQAKAIVRRGELVTAKIRILAPGASVPGGG